MLSTLLLGTASLLTQSGTDVRALREEANGWLRSSMGWSNIESSVGDPFAYTDLAHIRTQWKAFQFKLASTMMRYCQMWGLPYWVYRTRASVITPPSRQRRPCPVCEIPQDMETLGLGQPRDIYSCPQCGLCDDTPAGRAPVRLKLTSGSASFAVGADVNLNVGAVPCEAAWSMCLEHTHWNECKVGTTVNPHAGESVSGTLTLTPNRTLSDGIYAAVTTVVVDADIWFARRNVSLDS